MRSTEGIAGLVAEAALMLGNSEAIADANRPAWFVTLEGDCVFDIEYDDAQARVVVTSVVAEVPAAARQHVYEMLLQYNYLWTDTGGLRMALAGTPGPVVMMVEMAVPGLAPAWLCRVLTNMRNALHAWRQALGSVPAADIGAEIPMQAQEGQVLHAAMDAYRG